jgi:hypothetical protein
MAPRRVIIFRRPSVQRARNARPSLFFSLRFMRRLSIASTLLLTLPIIAVSATRLSAQGRDSIRTIQSVPRPSVGFSGGISLPAGGFAKQHIAGFNLAGVAEFRAPSAPTGLRGEVLYQYFGRKKNVTGAESSNTLAFLVNAVYHVPGYDVGPYFIGGIGLYHVSNQGNNAGLNGGAGITIPLTGMTAYAELRLHAAFTQGPAYVTLPLSFGVLF